MLYNLIKTKKIIVVHCLIDRFNLLTNMEKQDIQNRMQGVECLADFVKLLNDVKTSEFKTTKHTITKKQLSHFCNPKIVPNRYKTFLIKKKSGGLREINAPCRQLGILQYILNIVFKAVYTPNSSAMGFTEGRSVVSNASVHAGHHYVFNIDLENFFPSIPQARVWKRLQLPPFNLKKEIANVVAGLCCHPNSEKTMCVLPQGAPTSPLLTNAICDKLDRRMCGVAKRFGLHYSRYADDMTFSSMHNVYQEGSDFRVEIKRIIEDQGFKMNDKKTRLLRDGARQEVTGLIVNQITNVTRKYVHDIRWMLHCWEKDGYGKAYALFYRYYKCTKGYVKKGEPVMENVIDGKLNYMRMVKGEHNSAYRKLLERFNKLQDIVFVDNETDKGESYVYVFSYAMAEFEELFKTSITLEVSPKNKLIGKCTIDDREKIISISKSTKEFLCGQIEQKKQGETINADSLSKCFVTLCRSKGKNFWLITKSEMKRSKCLSVLNVNIDIDNLLDVWEHEGIVEAADLLNNSIFKVTSASKKPEPNNIDKEKKSISSKQKVTISDMETIPASIKLESQSELASLREAQSAIAEEQKDRESELASLREAQSSIGELLADGFEVIDVKW